MQEGFSARLKNAMAAKGFKQSDLIREAAVRGAKLGKSQVSQYVSGKTLPRKDVLELLASILETDQSLLSGETTTSSSEGDLPPKERADYKEDVYKRQEQANPLKPVPVRIAGCNSPA